MKKALIIGGISFIVIAVASAICLLHQPPLVRTNGVESVVVSVTGKGHKEIADPAVQKQIINQINKSDRQASAEDAGNGWNLAVYVYYADGTRESLWFTYEVNAAEIGVSEPTAEYMQRYPNGNYRIEDGTIVSLVELCESLDPPYSAGILPTERMKEEGLIE